MKKFPYQAPTYHPPEQMSNCRKIKVMADKKITPEYSWGTVLPLLHSDVISQEDVRPERA